ncbi:MAG TPA: Rieske 2Fe-2S domain-containing protein [Rubrivivax sp.]|nr:Rieske 2Fe-2S domain-containing protein [Rubrivivax sp.]
MHAAQNQLLTQIGPGMPCGELLRRYWQPVALLDEFDPRFDERMAERPLKPVRLLGQDLVLFRDSAGRWGLLDRDCPHRGADLAFARHEGEGIRCPFHGWKFDTQGRCLETPAEPAGSTLCQRVRQRSYPVLEAAGVLFAYLGPEGHAPPELPAFDAFVAPASHRFAFKGLWQCNWLQAFEVGIDPAHPSFLHRYLEDETSGDAAKVYGRQFRADSVGSAGLAGSEHWPMTRIMREFCSPEIHHEEVAPGLTRLTALRPMDEHLTHVRVTHAAFPHTFVIPLSETLTITQMHVPVDDTHTYWYSFFTSFGAPLDKETMRSQRVAHIQLPDYVPKNGRHNRWNFNPDEQRTRTYLGMGEDDINLHDQWAVESMGAIQDRTREHLGTSDKVIMANRRMLLKAIQTVAEGGTPPMVLSAGDAAALQGPDTIDCIAPAQGWQDFWQQAATAKREGAGWLQRQVPTSGS